MQSILENYDYGRYDYWRQNYDTKQHMGRKMDIDKYERP